MNKTCSKCGEEDKFAQEFGRKVGTKETTWETYAKMGEIILKWVAKKQCEAADRIKLAQDTA